MKPKGGATVEALKKEVAAYHAHKQAGRRSAAAFSRREIKRLIQLVERAHDEDTDAMRRAYDTTEAHRPVMWSETWGRFLEIRDAEKEEDAE